jgi:hypothetical protein
VTQDSETSTWVKNLPLLTKTTQSTTPKPGTAAVPKPEEIDFHLPKNPEEHKAMVAKLVGAGS